MNRSSSVSLPVVDGIRTGLSALNLGVLLIQLHVLQMPWSGSHSDCSGVFACTIKQAYKPQCLSRFVLLLSS